MKNKYLEYLYIVIYTNIIRIEYNLRNGIPRPIKINVLRKWLHGQSRGNSKGRRISTGTVSNIIKEYRQNDSKFDLLRQVALTLRNEGYSIESFACLVRIRQILTRLLLFSDTTMTAATRGGEIRRRVEEGNKNNINNSNNNHQKQQELVVEEEIES